MYLSSIKKAISYNTPTDCPLEALLDQIDVFSKRYNLELDPDFQRGHKWTVEQQIKFCEYVLIGGKVPPLLFNKCDGTLILVDGKQRLTALTKFLKNELPVFNGNYANDIEDLFQVLNNTYISIAINTLTSYADVIRWYLQINEGHIAHTQDDIKKAYDILNSI